jgi:Na+/melibiose symporter-like transporter
MIILKAILLINAFAAVSLRLFAHNNAQTLGDTAGTLNIVALIAMGVCLICALIWCVIIKKEEKAQKAAEEKSEENDGI